jgi:transcriptional regulator with XRE-family HTH domain
MTFGEKVKDARKKLNMTQAMLAEKVEVSLRTIAGYETDRSYPRTREAYKRLADALDVNVNHLLSDDEAFVLGAKEEFGHRGQRDAERLLMELTGLFAGGEMAEEDKDELMMAIQEAFITAKRNNKKYTPKKYLKEDGHEE